MGLALKEHIIFGTCAGRAVFLDYEENRYFCLSPALNDAFLSLQTRQISEDNELVGALQAAGVIRVVAGQDDLSPASIPAATSTLSEDPIGMTLASFSAITALECLRARCHLKHRPLRSFLDPSKAGLLYERDRFVAQDLISLVRHFQAQGRILSNRDRCLAHSIALRWRLEREGHGAALVFGVRLFPFQAHCWLQRGVTVLNDHHEHVAQYTPVLAA
ncbi:Transglutaminase-like superfamily protein [Sphingobium sp. AP50]|uniref:lasso peptide biosynthesis B2 protein n=1 Tax=Sphingobium sp. AP50 TaxID=1884369 RepID=UPI0008D471B2|nr:lasso peptide biosynthesis B2 protein [Sphingobium sp. AP50]SEJ92117.1 Transglutaminase-like superfamily protein [Sphingobium sp. AP50]